MRKHLLFLICGVLPAALQAQLLNGGFEQWQNLPTFEEPVANSVSFSSSNELTYFIDQTLSMYEVSGSESGSAMRVESTMTPFGPEVGFAIWGNIPEDGEEVIFENGFSFTDQSVTALSCDLRYNVNSSSPGFVIIQFKFNGALVGTGNLLPGTYIFPISGSQANFETQTFSIFPALPSAVDECVVGFATNAVFENDGEVFPGDFIEVDNLHFIGSDQAIPGGDFETWFIASSVLQPTAWGGLIFPGLDLVQQTTDASSGDFAVQLTTQEVDGNTTPALLTQGQINDDGLEPSIFVPGDFDGFTFDYKYTAVGSDSAYVIVVMSETLSPDPSEISFWAATLEPQPSYTEFTIDLAWMMGFMDVNYVAIAFFSSAEGFNGVTQFTPEIGSTLFVDNVRMNSSGGDPCDFAVNIDLGNELIICEGDAEVAAVPEGFESYQWFSTPLFGGATIPIEGANSNTLDIASDLVLFELYCVVTLGDCEVQSNALAIDQWVFAPTVVASDDTDLCEGESTTLEALGAEGTVFWFLNGTELEGVNDNPLTVTLPGEYVAAIAPDLCPNLLISSGLGPVINVSSNPSPQLEDTGNGVEVTLPFASYTWFFNGELVPNESGQSIPYQGPAGDYTVEVTNSAGCSGSATIFASSINESAGATFSVFPNPTRETLRVNAVGDYEIYGLDGRVLLSGQLLRSGELIDVSFLAPGAYLVKIGNSSRQFVKL